MCRHNPDCAHTGESWPDACSTYEVGRNGRCVYCDHAGKCHQKWGDIFNRARQRGEGIDSAANIAELWHMKHKPSRRRYG